MLRRSNRQKQHISRTKQLLQLDHGSRATAAALARQRCSPISSETAQAFQNAACSVPGVPQHQRKQQQQHKWDTVDVYQHGRQQHKIHHARSCSTAKTNRAIQSKPLQQLPQQSMLLRGGTQQRTGHPAAWAKQFRQQDANGQLQGQSTQQHDQGRRPQQTWPLQQQQQARTELVRKQPSQLTPGAKSCGETRDAGIITWRPAPVGLPLVHPDGWCSAGEVAIASVVPVADHHFGLWLSFVLLRTYR